ncbi:MAG: insulinase family protein [Rhodobacteraceae bacterium]|nr:insulinase family protein [Paracoccaceae bacterium]
MSRLFLALLAALSLAAPVRAGVDIQDVTSPGGIRAWLVEEHQIPFVALELRFKGGASVDAPGKRGAINLMTGLIEEGAGDLDARGFAAAQQALAAKYEFDVYDDALNISARFLTENRDQAVALLRTALIEPRFDQDAVDRVRGQVLSIIRSDLKDPDEIARARFSEMVYGDHPYGSSLNGTIDSVMGLTRDDVVSAHRGVLTRENLFVGAVGDISAQELGVLLDTLLGDLPAAGAAAPQAAGLDFAGGNTVVDYETPQSVALFGHAGIARDDPDFFAAFVLNTVLGAGSFDSRLMQEVREERGLTYGVYTYLADKDHAKLMIGRVASANDRIAEAIEVIRGEWARIAAEGVSQEELELAKTYLTGAYPLRFDGNARIAGILANMQMSDMPIDYIASRNDKVRAVTLQDVARVAARLLDPEHLTFVVVGQPEGLEGTN